MQTYNVGVYLFDDVEVLDFAGPFEVFSTAARVHARLTSVSEPLFQPFIIDDSKRSIRARGGLLVTPHYDIASHPPIDILLIPGGVVTAELERGEVIDWIRRMSSKSTLTTSVCTGAFLLAQAGLLRSRKVTTHWEDVGDLIAMFPDVSVEAEERWVESDDVITSAGISAGLDMSLHVVARLAGVDLAVKTAHQMDYEWRDARYSKRPT